MPEALAAPHFTLIRTAAAPVLADANDPAMATGMLMKDFQYVTMYWTGLGAADADLLTCRVLLLDEEAAVNPLLGLVWLRCIAIQLQRGVRHTFKSFGSRMQVRIDAFSNPAVPCDIYAAGVR